MIRTRSRMLLVVLVFGSAACSREAPTTPSVSDSGSVSHGSVGLTQHFDSIVPTTVLGGSGDTRVVIDGSGFKPGIGPGQSFAVLGDDELSTRFVSSSQLIAVIPAKFLTAPTSAQRFVVNGDGMGWSDGHKGYPRSNIVTFEITAP